MSNKQETIPDQILGAFGEQIQKLITEAVGKKTKELENKEKELKEREEKVNKILSNQHASGIINIQVGNQKFVTAADILTSIKDTYFTAMLNPQFKKMSDDTYFIARDPTSFQYVLEFLTYGSLLSDIQDEGVLKKLIADADFYQLPALQKQAKDMLTQQQKKNSPPPTPTPAPTPSAPTTAIYAKLQNASHNGSGSYWSWNSAVYLHPEYFTLTTTSNTNDTITFKKQGVYLISVRTAFCNSNNGYYLALYLNGSDVARCYNNFNTNYSASTQICEVFKINANQYIQIYQSYNNSAINGNPNNQLSIVYLGQ